MREISYNVNDKLKMQSVAFDYVFDEHNNPQIEEICYGYAVKIYGSCEDYWHPDRSWHAGNYFDFVDEWSRI